MPGAGAAWLAVAATLGLILCARADLIFRVPEVLVRHAAAPKSVGTGRSNYTSATVRVNDTKTWSGDDVLEVSVEEYFVEHEVSTADARLAARALNLDEVPATRVGCGACSRRDLNYCETRLLADHCCCEMHFMQEPFPWLPHTCYMGPNRCRPLAHDCARYARLRDCCCYRKLAERWKSILSKSSRVGVSGASLLLLSMLLFVAYL